VGRARDRILHSWRRRRARNLLAERSISRVLVLCHANLCRSPFAAGVLRLDLESVGRSDIIVRSAGFVGPERGSPTQAVQVAGESGVDLSSHHSAIVTSDMLGKTDLIVVMSSDQANDIRWRGAPSQVPVLILGDLDPNPIDGRTIFDPWRGDETVFRSSYGRIVRCVYELSRILTSREEFAE